MIGASAMTQLWWLSRCSTPASHTHTHTHMIIILVVHSCQWHCSNRQTTGSTVREITDTDKDRQWHTWARKKPMTKRIAPQTPALSASHTYKQQQQFGFYQRSCWDARPSVHKKNHVLYPLLAPHKSTGYNLRKLNNDQLIPLCQKNFRKNFLIQIFCTDIY